MNWFEKLITNGNSHNVGGLILLLVGMFAPGFVPLANAAIGAAGLFVTGAMLPGGSILPTSPTPVPTPAGSYHGIDYANLAANIIEQIKRPPVETTQGRS